MTPEQAAAELACLTPRQREVLVMTAKGYDARKMAGLLGMSFRTVESHNAAIRKRLNMTTIEAAVLAAKAGWV